MRAAGFAGDGDVRRIAEAFGIVVAGGAFALADGADEFAFGREIENDVVAAAIAADPDRAVIGDEEAVDVGGPLGDAVDFDGVFGAAEGGEVTGSAMFDRLATSSDILNFPDDNPLECGLAPEYPTICSFVFPLGEYIEGGEIRTIPGFEAFNVSDYLP